MLAASVACLPSHCALPQLASIALHESLQRDGRKTLLDCVPGDKLRGLAQTLEQEVEKVGMLLRRRAKWLPAHPTAQIASKSRELQHAFEEFNRMVQEEQARPVPSTDLDALWVRCSPADGQRARTPRHSPAHLALRSGPPS